MKPKHLAVAGRVALSPGEIVEGHLSGLDQVPGDERCSLGRSLLRALDTALPLQHGPAVEARFRQQREDPLEVDLAVAQGTEPPGPLVPRLIAAIDPHPATGAKL